VSSCICCIPASPNVCILTTSNIIFRRDLITNDITDWKLNCGGSREKPDKELLKILSTSSPAKLDPAPAPADTTDVVLVAGAIGGREAEPPAPLAAPLFHAAASGPAEPPGPPAAEPELVPADALVDAADEADDEEEEEEEKDSPVTRTKIGSSSREARVLMAFAKSTIA
jgi:hypothetical protein